jgi:curved DNA-binding protein CbpA
VELILRPVRQEELADDPYMVLGVTADDDLATIRRAFRRLVKRYHPQHSQREGTELMYDSVVCAYRKVSNPDWVAEQRLNARFADGEW